MEKLLEYINLFFYAIFFIEMIIKLIGFGIKHYFRDFFNIFDFIVVIISTIDILLT